MADFLSRKFPKSNPSREVTMMRMPFCVVRFAAISLPLACLVQAVGQSPAQKTAPSRAELYGRLPLSFEANGGQTDPQVRYLSRGDGYSLFLTDSEAVLALSRGRAHQDVDAQAAAHAHGKNTRSKEMRSDVVRMRLIGAKPNVHVTGTDRLPGTANYFIGNDPKRWRSDLPTYAKVKYEGVYPGVDLIYYGNQRQLEYDFAVRPGADPKTIHLRFTGADKLALDPGGDLRIAAAHGDITLRRPVIYQVEGGEHRPVSGEFILLARNQVGFRVGAYDRSQPLIIDPILTYATYLGGSNGFDSATGIAVDNSGYMYITGAAGSTNFPTTQGSLQTGNSAGLGEAFVAKLSSTGSEASYVTYLGGQGGASAAAIVVDGSGNTYVTGSTSSGEFPVTTGAFQTELPSYEYGSGFVSKLNSDGSSLVFSTFLAGGHGKSSCTAIALDSAGHTFVTGYTSSAAFPTTSGAFQSTDIGSSNGVTNAFASEFSSDGTSLVYSTYLGGTTGSTHGTAIALDTNDDVYLTGYTTATDFPVSKGAFQFTLTGSQAAFVTAFNPSGSALIYSTYLGGTSSDSGYGIAVDGSGNAYVTGQAISSDFPITPGVFQPTLGGWNAFVTKVDPAGNKLIYSTFLGGSGRDSGAAIAIDGLGEAYLTGKAGSSNFPITPNALGKYAPGGGDAFVSKLNATGTQLLYSTYLGGSQSDSGSDLVLDSSGNAYIAGLTYSSDFPVISDAFETVNNAAVNEYSNGFAAELAIGGETTTTLTSSTNPQLQNLPVTFTAVVSANFSDQIPTGGAVFTIDGGTGITVALDDTGKASYTTSSLSPKCGGHAIAVTYSGDSNFLTSSASLTQTIVGAPASIAPASGTGQSGTYGSFFSMPLVAIVKDACSNPVFSTSVTFAGTGATLLATQPTAQMNPGLASFQVTTGSNGEASVYAYAATSGAVSVTAPVAGVTTPASFTLNAAKAQLTFTASNATAIYNQPLPQLFFTITGFVNGDGTNVLGGAPTISTTATVGSPVGAYPIVIGPGTLAASNYTFMFVNGALTIIPEPQTIAWSFNPSLLPKVVYGDGPYTVTATSTCMLPVSPIVVTSGPGVLNGHMLTITGAGPITITGTQAGDTNCLHVTSSTTINVQKKHQTVTLSAPKPSYTYPVKDPIRLTAKASSGLPVTLRVVSGPAILVGDELKVIGAGLIKLQATQSGDNDYFAATSNLLEIDIKRGDQSIIFPQPKSPVTYPVKPIELKATASSGLPVKYVVVSGPGRIIRGNYLEVTGVGKIEVEAEQKGDADYDAATSVTKSIKVNKAKSSEEGNDLTKGAASEFP
jgi:hypothetical protein